jgi:hypothetical protein
MANVKAGAYENVRSQIGYCGIWCGSCVVGNGALRELAAQLESVLAAYEVSKWGPRDFDYQELSRGLASLRRIPICRGCVKGGGAEDCSLRACATGKGLDHCTLCCDQANCPHSERLHHMRTGARAAGLFVRNLGDDREEFLADSEAQLKTRRPSCLLFPR